MIKNSHIISGVCAVAFATLLTACGAGKDDTGTEFAPQMYHSIPYEPYSQILDTTTEYYNTLEYNARDGKYTKGVAVSNQRVPVTGTIARKHLTGTPTTDLASDIMVYNIPADSIDYAARVLKNPLPNTEAVTEQGKVLYIRYCSPCHGADGKGDGKVAAQYKGVPAYNAGRVATVSEGHIFHTITYGKGRMWPHGTQVNPEERWKIVRYVQTLQKQQ